MSHTTVKIYTSPSKFIQVDSENSTMKPNDYKQMYEKLGTSVHRVEIRSIISNPFKNENNIGNISKQVVLSY